MLEKITGHLTAEIDMESDDKSHKISLKVNDTGVQTDVAGKDFELQNKIQREGRSNKKMRVLVNASAQTNPDDILSDIASCESYYDKDLIRENLCDGKVLVNHGESASPKKATSLLLNLVKEQTGTASIKKKIKTAMSIKSIAALLKGGWTRNSELHCLFVF